MWPVCQWDAADDRLNVAEGDLVAGRSVAGTGVVAASITATGKGGGGGI